MSKIYCILVMVFLGGVLFCCGGGDSPDKRCRMIETEKIQSRYPGWECTEAYHLSNIQPMKFQKKMGGYTLQVSVADDMCKWFYEVIPLDKSEEVITSTPRYFSDQFAAAQSCEAYFEKNIKK